MQIQISKKDFLPYPSNELSQELVFTILSCRLWDFALFQASFIVIIYKLIVIIIVIVIIIIIIMIILNHNNNYETQNSL